MDWVATVGIIIGVLNTLGLAVWNRSVSKRDALDSKIAESITALHTKVEMLMLSNKNYEKELEQCKSSLNSVSETTYKANKAMDSTTRAHERLDGFYKIIDELKTTMTMTEKGILRQTFLIETLQERIGQK